MRHKEKMKNESHRNGLNMIYTLLIFIKLCLLIHLERERERDIFSAVQAVKIVRQRSTDEWSCA